MRYVRPLFAAAGLALVLGAAAGSPAFGKTSGQDPVRDKRNPVTADFAPPKLWERVEITLFGGLGIPIAGWTTLHYSEIPETEGPAVAAENRIKISSGPDVFAGAAATFFLKSGVGIQAGFGYLKSGLEAKNTFRYSASPRAPESYTASESGAGELTAVPVFLCLFNKFEVKLWGQTLRAYVTAGPALFLNSVLAEVRGGAALVRGGEADAFLIPVAVADTTWVTFGATAGVGLDIPLSKSLALNLEGRYFYATRKNFPWNWEPGVYNGLFGRLTALEFEAAAAAAYDRDTTYLTIDPSLIQIAGGLKVIF